MYEMTKSCWRDLTDGIRDSEGDPAERGLVVLFAPVFLIYTTMAVLVETVMYACWGLFWLIGKLTGA